MSGQTAILDGSSSDRTLSASSFLTGHLQHHCDGPNRPPSSSKREFQNEPKAPFTELPNEPEPSLQTHPFCAPNGLCPAFQAKLQNEPKPISDASSSTYHLRVYDGNLNHRRS